MKHLNILVFSASFGAGHVRAAQALIEELHRQDAQTKINHVDFGAFLSRTFNVFLKSTYIEVIKHTPKLWGKFYYRTAKIPPHSVFQRFLSGLGRRELLKYIHAGQPPDLIICTYPTVAIVLAELRQQHTLATPLVTVITDYGLHNHWVHPGVDLYIVGCDRVCEGLLRHGISKDKIKVTGIPVSPRFENPLSRKKIALRLGIHPARLTLLVMGGAYGVLDNAKYLLKYLDALPDTLQILMVCGKDERLYRSLDETIQEARHQILRFGFVNNVEELMTVSDLIITKAGGLTVSEALTRKLPVLIYKPIPGQEEENAAFLQTIGAGRVAYDDDELARIVEELVTQPEKLLLLRQAAERALPGRSAERAVKHMLDVWRRESTGVS
ncbi:MAG: glycosyltransferase [Peptococcaceae bacterium]|nr:glycosyltransferase [Peptococcaceae bacterium]